MTTASEPDNITNRSGGADLNAQGDVDVGGDVVGRDKVTYEEKIETGGGAYIGGSITVALGGKFVGRDEIVYEAPIVGVDMLHQLPGPPADFTGREKELVELLEKFEQGVTISGLQGQGGIGKTALALCLAARLVKRYPDAQIFLDLKGVSSSPLTAAEIMAYIVRSFDLMAKLPEDESGLAAAYRSALFNKRVLLLLDNARDVEQIKPLMPPPTGCGVIVTSRAHFYVPGLHAQNLEALPKDDASALLSKIVERIGDEADHIARLCGYLPLMLTMAGSALAERIDLSPASYAHRLEDERTRLDMVKASFTLSYELLSEELRETWRMLAVFPNTFEVTGAMAVCGLLEHELAEMRLSDLVRYSLVEWDEARKRYHLHDMARVFANSKLNDDDRAAAHWRHAKIYWYALAAAESRFIQGNEMQGLALFDEEWENIRVGHTWAANAANMTDRLAQLCCDYANDGANCLGLRLHPREWLQWSQIALESARRLKNLSAEAQLLANTGAIFGRLGESERVIEYVERARKIYHEIGDRDNEKKFLVNLGAAYYYLGKVRHAIQYYEEALAYAREIKDQRNETICVSNLGQAHLSLGEIQRAREYFEQALQSAHEAGDWYVEGVCMTQLSGFHWHIGELQLSIELGERALKIFREIGDRFRIGSSLAGLGTSYSDLGEKQRAIEYYEEALIVAREMGDRRGEGFRLGNLGLVYSQLGDVQRALVYLEQALEIAREIGNKQEEGRLLSRLGSIYADFGEVQRAIDLKVQALMIARETDDRAGEGETLAKLSSDYYSLGEIQRAVESLESACKIFKETQDPREVAACNMLAQWKTISRENFRKKKGQEGMKEKVHLIVIASSERQRKKKWQFWKR